MPQYIIDTLETVNQTFISRIFLKYIKPTSQTAIYSIKIINLYCLMLNAVDIYTVLRSLIFMSKRS